MELDKIKSALNEAINKLLDQDRDLLVNDVNERSISHRLACYLEPYFKEWDVDCEYNRNHDDIKRLELDKRNVSDQDLEAVTVYPDIIVNKRSTDKNLLVIAMKKTTSKQKKEYDIKKLRGFKRQLGYKVSAFVCFPTGNSIPINPTVEPEYDVSDD